MKGKEEVIAEFNEYVNMTAEELESWLKSDDANSAGWPKDDAEGDGETVGHDSGRRIVEILKANPDKKEDEYTDEQVEHMRKVVSYCKRHLAQESKTNSEKSPEEVKKTKSYASLKNWGHDFLKAQGSNGKKGEKKEESKDESKNGEEKAGSNGSKKENGSKKKAGEEKESEEADAKEDEEEESEEKAGDKRKAGQENGSNKKRQTRQGEGKAAKSDENGDDEKEEEEEAADDEDGDEDMEEGDKENGGGKTKGPKKGDKVSWNWGGGQPEGKVLDVKGEKTSIETKNGNEVSRDGKPEDPAVVLDTGKSKAIKSAHELNETE
ncbi:hypothetical protein C8034_v002710 [Colletotrichum sidae]|uniref:Hypervirulence associated protein TUDOR domain-containing protein n=1 Tax=Colletotrichum sidae TaxID=1347389 RepID=A0A4R8TBX8_9PEZI|nr:hypothetical protein C8034_v002710 [Colletotrichum sidae]